MPRPFPTRRGAGLATGLAVAGTSFAVALAPAGPADAATKAAAATKAKPALRVHVLFSGGRTTGFRVGEPLQVDAGAKKISKLCWSVAPLDRPACGTRTSGLGPSKTGPLTVIATLKSGGTLKRTLQIGAATTKLPASIDAAAGNGGKVVVYELTCGTTLYLNQSKGKLADPVTPELAEGDHVAGAYRAAKGVVQVYAYRGGHAGFVADTCLKAAG